MIMVKDAKERCRRYRRRILEISQQVSALHIAPAFSCVEIVDAIYNELVKPDDIFIMSKGHGCMIQYVILEERGVIPSDQLDFYCKPNGYLGAHPDYGVPGIRASTGSLGHGLSIAVGQAYAEKLKGRSTTVYCLLSDGECQEGSTWEAFMMGSALGLSNLVAFIDYNDFGGLAPISETHPNFNLHDKVRAFGWHTRQVEGHNSSILGLRLSNPEKPKCLICETTKGKGVSFMENAPIWHYRSPNPEEYQKALAELD